MFTNSRDMEKLIFEDFTFPLKTASQPFCMTLWVLMMHHHIKFGCIQFSGSGDIFNTKV